MFFARVPPELRTFEHRYILLLSGLLVAFNDPLYGLTLLLANYMLTALSTVFVTFFVSALLLFWLIMFQRAHKEWLQVGSRLVQPGVLVAAGLVFVCLSVTGLLTSVAHRFDPGMHVYERRVQQLPDAL